LELLDLVRDGRLAQLQALRGEAEARQVGHGFERAQLAESDRAVEVELSWGLGHGAYDMPYGSAETPLPFACAAHHSEPRRRGGAAARGGDRLRAEDQPVPQAPLPGSAR